LTPNLVSPLPSQESFDLLGIRRYDDNLRRNSLARIHLKKPRGPQAAFASPQLANIYNIPRGQGNSVQYRAPLSVGDRVILVFYRDIDSAYPTSNTFFDCVNKVQKSWFFKKSGFSPDICKHISYAAVFLLEGFYICLHL
jgi:hypothetical protein